MSMRLWLNVSAVLGMGLLVSYMSAKEMLVAKKSDEKITYVDRFVKFDVSYAPRNREDNLESAFGMSPKMMRAAKKSFKRHDKQRNKIARLLKDAMDEDPKSVERCFCDKGAERPRYWALQFLLEKDGSNPPNLISLKQVSSLQVQEWSEVLPIDFVYRTLELRSDPQIDATLMWIGAVLTEQVDDIRARNVPFGDGANWSWDEFLKTNKGMDIKIADYIALMHVFAEVANDPSEAICFSE
ncbi:MAG: hypothetical protein VX278_11680 [Myxococcota bacterium]|nr:hypothetical protein [Myxococcota bacterium]